jgi:pyridoxine/pyridoxamine 5'-phosphate oxidase
MSKDNSDDKITVDDGQVEPTQEVTTNRKTLIEEVLEQFRKWQEEAHKSERYRDN